MISYAIIDSVCYKKDPFLNLLSISNIADMVLYRDKECAEYEKNAKLFCNKAKECNFKKIILHERLDLALELGAHGVHLSQKNSHKAPEAKSKGLFTIVSAHDEKQIQKASKMGADAVTFGPIFYVPNKAKAKGTTVLKQLVDKFDIPIFALGGITSKEQIQAVRSAGVYGFASIRYFKDQP